MTAMRASNEVSKASMAGPHSALESDGCLPDKDPAFFLTGLVPPHRAACSETVLQKQTSAGSGRFVRLSKGCSWLG